MSIVDDYEDPPELKKDIFWNLTEPELIEHPEIIDIQDTEKVEVEVKQECKNVFHQSLILQRQVLILCAGQRIAFLN